MAHTRTHIHTKKQTPLFGTKVMSQVQMIVVCATSVVVDACRILQDYSEGVMVATRIHFTEFQTCKGVTGISICMKCECDPNIDWHRKGKNNSNRH